MKHVAMNVWFGTSSERGAYGTDVQYINPDNVIFNIVYNPTFGWFVKVQQINGASFNLDLGQGNTGFATKELAKAALDTQLEAWYDNGALASTFVSISVADWEGGTTVVKNVTGVTETNVVWASPSPASIEDATTFGVYASAQGDGTLTFTASATPTEEIIFNIIVGG